MKVRLTSNLSKNYANTMNKKVFIGIDNGVTGTFCVMTPDIVAFEKMPVLSMQDYCKAKKNITRLDHCSLHEKLKNLTGNFDTDEIIVAVERPMVNPHLFKASESALRCFESTWCVLERLHFPVVFVASTDWQKPLLPKGTKGATELKKASLDIGNRLYPKFENFKHPDRDGLLIAHWLRTIF